MLQSFKPQNEKVGIILPTESKDIDVEYISATLSHVNLAKNYAIVVLMQRFKLFDFLTSLNQKIEYNVGVKAVIGKINSDNTDFKVGQECVIDRSSIERGNQLHVPTALSSSYISNFFNKEKEYTKQLITTAKDVAKNYYWMLSFKIIPVCDIHATLDTPAKRRDMFIDKSEGEAE